MLGITVLVLLAKLGASAVNMDIQAKYETMSRHEFIEYFNKQNYSFKITDYGEDIQTETGVNMYRRSMYDFPLQVHGVNTFKDLPKNFDSREKWPQCKSIQTIYNQGSCDSCWTFGTADTASDRTCIHINIHVQLSQQDFECHQDAVCDGGVPGEAFEFWQKEGLVTQGCKPYNISKLKENDCVHECVDKHTDYNQDKHYAKKIYEVSSKPSDNIKAELFINGPIQAGFKVYTDFFQYKEGIYEHVFGDLQSRHSVRVIGYGVENKEEYWLVANSWGTGWGEEGHFRVKAFTEDLEFESYLLSGIPKS